MRGIGQCDVSPTFSRASSDVGFDLRPVGEGLGFDSETIGHALGQILHFQPQWAVPLHVHCHNLADPCGVRTVNRSCSSWWEQGHQGHWQLLGGGDVVASISWNQPSCHSSPQAANTVSGTWL